MRLGVRREGFVRSEAELGVYDESRKPTGHVLTALGGLYQLRLGRTRRGCRIWLCNPEANEELHRGRTQTTKESFWAYLMARLAGLRRFQKHTSGLRSRLNRRFLWRSWNALLSSWDWTKRLLAFKKDSGGDSKLAYRPEDACEGAEQAGRQNLKWYGPPFRRGGVDHPCTTQTTEMAWIFDGEWRIRASRGLWITDEPGLEGRLQPC